MGSTRTEALKVALLGCGSVGSQVVRLLREHSDDLAASIGVETPQFPGEAADAVFGLLASVAAERHGQSALLRALSRPQRSTGPVSAF